MDLRDPRSRIPERIAAHRRAAEAESLQREASEAHAYLDLIKVPTHAHPAHGPRVKLRLVGRIRMAVDDASPFRSRRHPSRPISPEQARMNEEMFPHD